MFPSHYILFAAQRSPWRQRAKACKYLTPLHPLSTPVADLDLSSLRNIVTQIKVPLESLDTQKGMLAYFCMTDVLCVPIGT